MLAISADQGHIREVGVGQQLRGQAVVYVCVFIVQINWFKHVRTLAWCLVELWQDLLPGGCELIEGWRVTTS